jgi:dihydrofolate reductase
MRKVVVLNNVSLDGVMQAPGRPDEDPRGGFTHGGWALPYSDPVMGKVMAEGMAQGGSLLLGHRTYEDFFSVWPSRTDNPFTEVLNNVQKYVASTTLKEPLPRCLRAMPPMRVHAPDSPAGAGIGTSSFQRWRYLLRSASGR